MIIMNYAFAVISILFVSSTLCHGKSKSSEDVAEVQSVEDTINNGFTESCTHENYVWKCCVGSDYKLNFTSCISIEYLPNEYGMELNVTLNGYLLINRKVSAKNPPPICFAAPYLEKIANVCFRFYDLDEEAKKFTGCIRIEGHVEGLKVFKYELGCFEIPLITSNNKNFYSVQLMHQLQ